MEHGWRFCLLDSMGLSAAAAACYKVKSRILCSEGSSSESFYCCLLVVAIRPSGLAPGASDSSSLGWGRDRSLPPSLQCRKRKYQADHALYTNGQNQLSIISKQNHTNFTTVYYLQVEEGSEGPGQGEGRRCVGVVSHHSFCCLNLAHLEV